MGEATGRALILGALLAVVFGAANAYIGLKVGMTVSASIPAAVVSMAILRGILRRGTILENNIVQTIASAGESLAAGVIFTIPGMVLLGMKVSMLQIFVISLVGGLLGVFMMIPLRKRLIEEEHDVLPYPEGTACARILKAGEEGGHKAGMVFKGFGLGALFKVLTETRLLKSTPGLAIGGLRGYIGLDMSPSLIGVGYILGLRIAALMFAGGLFGWMVLMPLIGMFQGITEWNSDTAFTLWSNYIRFIGAGSVFVGGLLSLIRTMPSIISSFKDIHFSFSSNGRDLPMGFVLGGVAVAIVMMITPLLGLPVWVALIAVVAAFVFVAVSSRVVGIVGSSSNPVSGMTIATLFTISFIFAKLGLTTPKWMFTALALGAVVCIAAAIAGDTSQDLKTGYLVGATPSHQQIAELIGVLLSAIFVGWTLMLLHKAYGFGTRELLAPQAKVMSMVVEGVLKGTLPWTLVFVGALAAITVELLGVRSLPFAVGLYLPIELSATVLVGGLLSKIRRNESGILAASGLVAGDAIMGIVVAIFVASGAKTELLRALNLGDLGSALVFVILAWLFMRLIWRDKTEA